MIINNIRHNKILRVILIVAVLSVSFFLKTTAGLHVALLGDSMTWIGGDSCQNHSGWSHFLKESGVADTIDVYARSGATWTNTVNTRLDTASYSEILHDDNVIYNQAMRLAGRIKDGTSTPPDLVIVFAGANDAWFSDRRPGIFDLQDSIAGYSSGASVSDATSLQKSVALTCDLLKLSLPQSKIVLITPLEMSKVPPEVITKVSDIIEKTANSRGIATFRADREVAIRHLEETQSPKYTSDGVHTNSAGASLLADFILNKIQHFKFNNQH